MKNNVKETLIATGLIFILIFLLNPFNIYYSNMMTLGTITILIVLYVFFAIFIWKDNPIDEREEIHYFYASRSAYLAGAAIALVGIVVQSLDHSIDIWLVAVLTGMIVGRIVSRKRSERNN